MFLDGLSYGRASGNYVQFGLFLAVKNDTYYLENMEEYII